jgi:hypothetical protein
VQFWSSAMSVHALQAPPLEQKSSAAVTGLTHATGVSLAQGMAASPEDSSPPTSSAHASTEL